MNRAVRTFAVGMTLLALPFAATACSHESEALDDLADGYYVTLEVTPTLYAGDLPEWIEEPDLLVTKAGADPSLVVTANFVADEATQKVRRTNVCEDINSCGGVAVEQQVHTQYYSLEELDAMTLDEFLGL